MQHWGFEFRYSDSTIPAAPLAPLPPPCQVHPAVLEDVLYCVLQTIAARALAESLTEQQLDQLTVNSYQPGQGIPPHTVRSQGISSLGLDQV